MILTPIAKATSALFGPYRDLNGESARLAMGHGRMEFACLMARLNGGIRLIPL